MDKYLKGLKKSTWILVKADKTENYYKYQCENLRKLTLNNITQNYKVVPEAEVDAVDREKLKLARHLDGNTDQSEDKKSGLARKLEKYSRQEAFVTIKDHKKSFKEMPASNKPARLIIPSRTNIGKVSNNKLQKINRTVREKTGLNQWISTHEVLKWFSGLPNKDNLRFFKLDVVSFYPSITYRLLKKSIDWARNYCTITELDEKLFIHCRRTFAFYDGKAWVKKVNPEFDVPMGSLDGAEICEIVGLFLLHKLVNGNVGLTREMFGLYRDDGLAVTDINDKGKNKFEGDIRKIFEEMELELDTEGGHLTKSVDFLDVRMHLETGEYEPYRKPGPPTIYVNKDSNHPPVIIRNLPAMIEKRVSGLCSSQEMFNKHAPHYNKALRDSGYKEDIKFRAQNEQNTPKNKRPRYKKQFWFNPPYNKAVATKVGKKFLELVKKHFPEGSKWHKQFNINTIKISYSCTRNMASHISGHNATVLREDAEGEQDERNKKKQTPCPSERMNGHEPCSLTGKFKDKCRTKGVVYQVLVKSGEKVWNYFGQTYRSFHSRWSEHKRDMKNKEKKGTGTALSAKVWELKNAGKTVKVEPHII